MKSTGLFGKNSGRVGGVVYSNYRGEQVVRSYQPKVSNPNTKRQVEQRAKFKLVSQISASLGKEIKMSFVPNVSKETPRNAFVKAMLKKCEYKNNQATLPIEDITLTNSQLTAIVSANASGSKIVGGVRGEYSDLAKIRVVIIGYNEGGQINVLNVAEPELERDTSEGENILIFQMPYRAYPGYTNTRALMYVYEPDTTTGTSYDDYAILSETATLDDILKTYSGRMLFSETFNLSLPQAV